MGGRYQTTSGQDWLAAVTEYPAQCRLTAALLVENWASVLRAPATVFIGSPGRRPALVLAIVHRFGLGRRRRWLEPVGRGPVPVVRAVSLCIGRIRCAEVCPNGFRLPSGAYLRRFTGDAEHDSCVRVNDPHLRWQP